MRILRNGTGKLITDSNREFTELGMTVCALISRILPPFGTFRNILKIPPLRIYFIPLLRKKKILRNRYKSIPRYVDSINEF